MNLNSSLGSYWKGRLNLRIIATQNDHPILSDPKNENSSKITQTIQEKNTLGNSDWYLKAELYYGFDFPDNQSYGVQIQLAEKSIMFDLRKNENGIIKWFEKKEQQLVIPYSNKNELPDIINYRLSKKGGKRNHESNMFYKSRFKKTN